MSREYFKPDHPDYTIRIAMGVEYQGTNFKGWQMQNESTPSPAHRNETFQAPSKSYTHIRHTVFQLRSTSRITKFIACLKVEAKYSAMLEPVTQQVHVVSKDMTRVRDHMNGLMQVFKAHRCAGEVLLHYVMSMLWRRSLG